MLDTETPPATLEEADKALTEGSEEAPEAAAVEPAAQPDGQPRDEQGRFAATPPAEPEAPAEPGAAAPAPEPGAEPQPTEAGAEPEPATPFTYRADNQEFAIPGSDTGDDGIFIPKDQVPELQHLLAAGRASFGSVRQRLSEAAQQVQAANQKTAAAEAQAQHVLAHFETLIERGELAGWLEQMALNWPVLKAEARAKAVEMQNQAEREQLRQYQERERQAALEPLMQQSLHNAVQYYGTQAGLDATVQAEVERRLTDPNFKRLLFIPAPYDDPASGFRQGETVINYGVVQNAIAIAATGRQPAAPPAAARPAAQVPPPKPAPKVPPTVGRGAAAPRPAQFPAFTTTKEADDWLLEGELPEPE